MASSPNQKAGMEMPAMAAIIATVSTGESL